MHLHHEQHPSVQAAFLKDVRLLIAVFEGVGNPFLEKIRDLMVLDQGVSWIVLLEKQCRSLKHFVRNKYTRFVEESLVKCERTPSQK